MALAWNPIDLPLVDAVAGLAGCLWDRRSLDHAWQQTGWPPPKHDSIAKHIFDAEEWPILPIGDWQVGIIANSELTRVRGFAVSFALLYEPDGIWGTEPDPDLVDFPQHIPSAAWQIDHTAGRAQFRNIWEAGCRTVTERLGPPNVIDDGWDDDSGWQHAIWRLGSRLLVVAQGDDITTYSELVPL